MNGYDKGVCEQKHLTIKEKLELYEKRLNSHSDEIHELQQVSAARTTEVTNICDSIENLNTRIDKLLEQNRNLILMLLTALIGFFIFCVEQGIFHK